MASTCVLRACTRARLAPVPERASLGCADQHSANCAYHGKRSTVHWGHTGGHRRQDRGGNNRWRGVRRWWCFSCCQWVKLPSCSARLKAHTLLRHRTSRSWWTHMLQQWQAMLKSSVSAARQSDEQGFSGVLCSDGPAERQASSIRPLQQYLLLLPLAEQR